VNREEIIEMEMKHTLLLDKVVQASEEKKELLLAAIVGKLEALVMYKSCEATAKDVLELMYTEMGID